MIWLDHMAIIFYQLTRLPLLQSIKTINLDKAHKMPAMTELERGALEAWTPAQQAALNHTHMAEQLKRDEERAAKEDAEKKKKMEREKGKKKDDGGIKVETITTEAVLGDLVSPTCTRTFTRPAFHEELTRQIKAHVPALFAFLDIFGPVQYSLPALFAVHIGAWYGSLILLPANLAPRPFSLILYSISHKSRLIQQVHNARPPIAPPPPLPHARPAHLYGLALPLLPVLAPRTRQRRRQSQVAERMRSAEKIGQGQGGIPRPACPASRVADLYK